MTRQDYYQFLLVSQINYTLTYFADHDDTFSHDAINRYLRRERIALRLIWDNVRDEIIPSPTVYLLFNDTVLDKDYSWQIELVRCPYSGNAPSLIRGISVVTCGLCES
jgi:hypothetical protein